ncbi:unnamed protein product [Amoebophrya sp. A120]|nr:unnamed protein product [Amoebophrya sp. A120]|eukprot:GSA120T00013367001.1
MSRPRVLYVFLQTDPENSFHPAIKQLCEQTQENAAVEFLIKLRPKLPEDLPFCEKCEILMISPFTGGSNGALLANCLSNLKKLKWIHSLSAGVDMIVPTLQQHYLGGMMSTSAGSTSSSTGAAEQLKMPPLTNAKHAFSYSLAEYALFAILFFTKQARRLLENQRTKTWDRFQMNWLAGGSAIAGTNSGSANLKSQPALGKKLGFIGFGSIGKACYDLLVGSKRRTQLATPGGPAGTGGIPWSQVLVHRRTRDSATAGSDGGGIATAGAQSAITFQEDFSTSEEQLVETHPDYLLGEYASKEDVFAKSDVIICTLPGTAETHHFCDMASVSLIPDGAIFVSLGRGSCVDEQALIQNAPRFAGIALDVFEKEPLPKESALWELPNVLVSPHNADLVSTYISDSWDVFCQRLLVGIFTSFSTEHVHACGTTYLCCHHWCISKSNASCIFSMK